MHAPGALHLSNARVRVNAPQGVQATLMEEIFYILCEEALKLGLISKIIAVYIEFTNKVFNDLVNPSNEDGITRTNKRPGRSRSDRSMCHLINVGFVFNFVSNVKINII